MMTAKTNKKETKQNDKTGTSTVSRSICESDATADFIPRTKEIKDVIAYFKSKNTETPAEVKAETKPKPKRERLSDEEKKKRNREYMREYLRRPGNAEKNRQRYRNWYARKKAEAKTA